MLGWLGVRWWAGSDDGDVASQRRHHRARRRPEARIVEQLAQEQAKRTPELNVGAASCPDGPPERTPGAVVLCTVEVEGVMVPYTVTFLGSRAESEGGGDNVEFRSAKPMVDVARIVGDIRDQAAVQLQVAPDRLTVDCGPAKVQVVDIGGRITCAVNDGRSTRRLAAVTDDTGNVAINEI